MNWKAQILIAASITLLGIGCTGEITSGGQNDPSGELSDMVSADADASSDASAPKLDGSAGDACTSALCSGEESAPDVGADAETSGDVAHAPDIVDTPDPDAGSEPDPDPDPITPTVDILSPSNGATVPNPVDFSITAEYVATVQIMVDDWPLSQPWDPQTQSTLEYTFSGNGSAREVVLYGYNSGGTEIARDTITITIQEDTPTQPPGKGTSIGTFYNTYYYVEVEDDFTGPKNAIFYDKNCNIIATVRTDFAHLACIEGTAKVSDGRMLNYYNGTNCGGACSFTWSAMSSSFPWGKGSRGNALVPLRSWAVDTGVIAAGTVVYVEEFDGMAIPTHGSLGGYAHDGCFRADDVGGAIDGNHVDIFTGNKDMYRALNALFVTRTNFTVYKNSPRCAHI